MAPMLAKFPFAPDATADATLAEIAAALAPGSGALWTFQQDLLGGVLEKQGARWVPAPNAPVALSQQFVEFFNRAAQASAGLFPAGATEPHVVVEAHATPTGQAPLVVLVQGTKEARFDKNSPPQQFVWPSATGRNAALYVESGQLLGVIRGAKRKYLARGAGDWALFRVVAQAAKSEGAHAEWVDKDAGTVAVDFTFENGGVPVLARGWLGRMTCTPQVTK
jgi:type VI secretion system protein ImpL